MLTSHFLHRSTGGRVNTDYSLTDFPLELGAEFIHGDETEASTHRFVKGTLFSCPSDRLRYLKYVA